MTAPGSAGRRALAARLAGIGLAAAGVAIALYVAGRLHTPDATSALFGQTGLGAVRLKSMLASIALGVAGLQVLLGAWMYRMLPLAGSPPRPVRRAHRITGFALFGFTVPIAAHCLITYGVQLTSPRVAVHSLAGCFFLRRLRRQGAPGAQQAAARLGAAGCRGHARGCRRRAVVHIGAVVLQRLPAPRHVKCGPY